MDILPLLTSFVDILLAHLVGPFACNTRVTGAVGVVVITTAQLHSTNPELRFCAGSNSARGVSEIRDGEDL